MGSVYEAHDPDLDRGVAVKVLHRRYTDDARAKQRLVREATTMAKLSHPNVVEVFEVGEARGEVFIAMELVDGAPLSQWLESPRSVDAICRVFVDAGKGLAAAHAAGIVHRDFKPHNVLVDRRGWAKVMDFGLAGNIATRLTPAAPAPGPERSADSGSLTQTGAQLGTPQYMSPEQHHGGEVGPKSDQWNFCVALHDALHGTLPFAGETLAEVRASVDAMRIEIGDKNVPPWLDAVIRRGLQRDPAARFATMDDLIGALRRGRRSIAPWALIPIVGIAAVVFVASAGGDDAMCEGASARLAGVWDAERRTATLSSLAAAGASEPVIARFAETLDAYVAGWVETHTSTCERQRGAGRDVAATFDAKMSCLRGRWGDLEGARRSGRPRRAAQHRCGGQGHRPSAPARGLRGRGLPQRGGAAAHRSDGARGVRGGPRRAGARRDPARRG